MYPELFTIPGLNISVHSFGLMLVIGLLCAMELAKRLARRVGLDGEAFINAGIVALVFGIAGARLSHVLENFSQYTDPSRSALENLKAAVNITSGGLTYYGGFLLAFPACVIYARMKKIPVRLGMDIVAPGIMIGLAFGRLGCLLNGCCYGAECELPWAIKFPYGSIAYFDQVQEGKLSPPEALRLANDYYAPAEEAFKNPLTERIAKSEASLPLHPAQIYSSLTAFLLAGICLAYFTVPHVAGRGLALMMMLEGVARFLLESVRAEPAVVGHMSFSMVVGIGVFGMGLLMWVVLGEIARRRGETLEPALHAPAAVPALTA